MVECGCLWVTGKAVTSTVPKKSAFPPPRPDLNLKYWNTGKCMKYLLQPSTSPGSSSSVGGNGELQPMTGISHHVARLGAGLVDLLCCGTLSSQCPGEPRAGVWLLLVSICFSICPRKWHVPLTLPPPLIDLKTMNSPLSLEVFRPWVVSCHGKF